MLSSPIEAIASEGEDKRGNQKGSHDDWRPRKQHAHSVRGLAQSISIRKLGAIHNRVRGLSPGARNGGELLRVVGVERPPTLWLCLVHIIQTVAGAAGQQQRESDDC